MSVSEDLKTLYKTKNIPKCYEIYFPEIDLYINASGKNDKIVNGSFSLTEGICSRKDLKFGDCGAAQVKFTVADITQDLTGKWFILKQKIEEYTLDIGTYRVDTCKKQNEKRFKDISARNSMTLIETDVATWYNALTFPMTLAAFRTSFLNYVGLTEDASNLPLPNDSMIVDKPVTAAQLSGRDVIEAIEEINSVFGVINPAGEFSHVILKPTYGLYPGTFYPGQEYPRSETDTSYVTPGLIDETITIAMRESIHFEEYTVPEIDKLIIRSEEDDIGAIVGTGTNAYIIEGNFLVFGKSAGELQTIAANAFGYMARRPYRPFNANSIGLPYLKPGDMVKYDQNEPVVGYMLNRTLRGIQGLRDETAAPGSQQRTQITSKNTEIIKLKYRTTKLKVDLDGVLIEVSDLAESTSSAITVLYDNINLKVDKAGVVQSINLSTEGAKIDVTKLDINGIVTANNNFKILLDGSMEAVNGKFQGQITGGSININGNFIVNSSGLLTATGATINGSFHSSGSGGSVDIIGGGIDADLVQSQRIDVVQLYLDGDLLSMDNLEAVRLARPLAPSQYISLDSTRHLIGSTSDNYSIGTSGRAWTDLYITYIYHQSGGQLGFFGTSPISRRTVSKLSTGADLPTTVSKLNALLDALGPSIGYGFIAL